MKMTFQLQITAAELEAVQNFSPELEGLLDMKNSVGKNPFELFRNFANTLMGKKVMVKNKAMEISVSKTLGQYFIDIKLEAPEEIVQTLIEMYGLMTKIGVSAALAGYKTFKDSIPEMNRKEKILIKWKKSLKQDVE